MANQGTEKVSGRMWYQKRLNPNSRGVSILHPTSILLYIIYSSLKLMYVHNITVIIGMMFSLIRLNNH